VPLHDRLKGIVSALEAGKTLAWKDGQPSEELQVAQQYWAERLEWVVSPAAWIERDKSVA